MSECSSNSHWSRNPEVATTRIRCWCFLGQKNNQLRGPKAKVDTQRAPQTSGHSRFSFSPWKQRVIQSTTMAFMCIKLHCWRKNMLQVVWCLLQYICSNLVRSGQRWTRWTPFHRSCLKSEFFCPKLLPQNQGEVCRWEHLGVSWLRADANLRLHRTAELTSGKNLKI